MAIAQESDSDYHLRMKWWNDGRPGMLLHRSVYSTYGGKRNGQDCEKEYKIVYCPVMKDEVAITIMMGGHSRQQKPIQNKILISV